MAARDEVIAVIGAGIIGAAAAFELRRRGRAVALIERDAPGSGASYGNMASIGVTEFVPVSRPSTWARIPRWLLDRDGPVRVRPGYLPRMLPWLLRFLVAGRPSRVTMLEAAGAAMCARVYDDLLPMLDAIGLSHLLTKEGCLCLYMNEREVAADRPHLEAIERFGFRYEKLSAGAVRELEPAISPRVSEAILLPDNRSIRDPYRLVVGLVERFRAMGGELEKGEALAFQRQDGRVTSLIFADGRQRPVTDVVLATGAHTGRLSRLLGERIPLESERGYHTQIMAPGIGLRHSIISPARAFMITPTAGGIRVGGTVEMAGLDAPPDYRRAKAIVRHARTILPELRIEQATEWMGHRPALPDTVPIIGRSATAANVVYAAGHGHLGLTLAATTARMVADLIAGMTPPIDMTPYRVDRF